jgi:SAM-dependent methyltransferase
LILGDALNLPVASRSFEAVVTVHLFHLLSSWRVALAEARRVLRPGGVLLSGYDWRPPGSPGARLLVRWREILRAAGLDDQGGGAHDYADIQAALVASGAQLTERFVGEWSVTRTLARQIETIEHRTWTASADVPADLFPRCLAELRDWAAATFGGLDQAYAVAHQFVWQRYTWDG